MIEEASKEYLIACYSNLSELPTSQLAEVKQAFMGGILWAMSEMTEIGRNGTEQEAMAHYDQIIKELDAYQEARYKELQQQRQ